MKKILLIISIVSLFQLQGSEVLSFDPAATKALFNAIENKDIEGIERALEAGADPNGIGDAWHIPLTRVASLNVCQAVPILVEKGADINKQNRNERTPLMIAANSGRKEMVKALLKDGANIHIKGNDGFNALIVAAASIEILEMLLRAGADVNGCNNHGITPLLRRSQIAYWHPIESKDAILFLLNAGADVTAKDNEGKKALDYINEDLKRSFNPRLDEIAWLLEDVERLNAARLDDNAAFDEIVRKKYYWMLPKYLRSDFGKKYFNENFEQLLPKMAERDCVNSAIFLNPETLKGQILKKIYEDYYKGYPDALLKIVGDPSSFTLFKEKYFKEDFINKLKKEKQKADEMH